jgi:hypothetical protein
VVKWVLLFIKFDIVECLSENNHYQWKMRVPHFTRYGHYVNGEDYDSDEEDGQKSSDQASGFFIQNKENIFMSNNQDPSFNFYGQQQNQPLPNSVFRNQQHINNPLEENENQNSALRGELKF